MKIRWISKHAVMAIHAEQIAEHGGASGIRDQKMLDSALARPKNLVSYENPSVFKLAAAYAFGVIKNHPFIDGNKRAALVVSGAFLYLNGWELNAPEAEAASVFFDLADGAVSESELAKWFEENSGKLRA
ncbi:MAG: type II toxin-antitoxin system death-on-curing family toxin [Candidatus Nitrospinota bacterium M3_3B_026]